MYSKKRHFFWGVAVVVLAAASFAVGLPLAARALESDALQACASGRDSYCFAPAFSAQLAPLATVAMPKLATPNWMAAPSGPRVVTYRLEGHGDLTADLGEFGQFAAATLNDPRGWSRLGVRFDQVASGGDFVLVLSAASRMTDFSATGCDTTYSCNVGNNVVINEDRWKGGAPAWNDSGASLEGYRQMVVNHETGHWLGHGHRKCASPGQVAAVMQQQSMSLSGCIANSWPLTDEMYAPRLGIRS